MIRVPLTDVERVMADLGLDEEQAKQHVAQRERMRTRDMRLQNVRRKICKLKLKDLK